MHAVTPKDTIHREGTARIYRFRRPELRPAGRTPILLVPSLINRWYVLDLLAGSSVAGALSSRFDTYCLDWGVPNDEDRYLSWESILRRLARAVRRVKRDSGADKVVLLGYCMGGTLTSIHAALEPESIAAMINLAGPIDFAQGGFLSHMVEPRWFDPSAIAGIGNMSAAMMQSGFVALRPTLQLSKWVNFAGQAQNDEARTFFNALERWSNDNAPFPAAAYETYIRELYQENRLIRGEHWVFGKRVDLSRIRCPVLTIVAEKDTICPPPAAIALNEAVLSNDVEVLSVPGGHVGAVVGARARDELYPRMLSWLAARAA